MKLAVIRQTQPHERRVPLTPEVAKKLVGQGIAVEVECGAGALAHQNDEAYEQAGAQLIESAQATAMWGQADVVVTIEPPASQQIAQMRPGSVLVGMLAPMAHVQTVADLARQRVTAFSMEFLPRISRAQSMDVLSSQANIAGYKAVLRGADACAKIFPMMMTAAGTIAPSRVLVIGAGVAGLQAIATARRLGAVVEAYDIRPEVEEQIRSLGARFVKLPTAQQDSTTEGGYAKQQSQEQRDQQVALMTKHVLAADVVIATAAVFGKAPPLLIPASVVAEMNAGAVIVDLAADADAGRGNCELTKPGERYATEQGVVIDGTLNLPSLVPVHASQSFANNLFKFLQEITEDGQIKLNLEDEIQNQSLITHDGQIVNQMVKQAVESSERLER